MLAAGADWADDVGALFQKLQESFFDLHRNLQLQEKALVDEVWAPSSKAGIAGIGLEGEDSLPMIYVEDESHKDAAKRFGLEAVGFELPVSILGNVHWATAPVTPDWGLENALPGMAVGGKAIRSGGPDAPVGGTLTLCAESRTRGPLAITSTPVGVPPKGAESDAREAGLHEVGTVKPIASLAGFHQLSTQVPKAAAHAGFCFGPLDDMSTTGARVWEVEDLGRLDAWADPEPGESVRKCGATTGHTEGRVTAHRLTLRLPSPYGGDKVFVSGAYAVENKNLDGGDAFAAAGDEGSPLVAERDGARVWVGQIIATTPARAIFAPSGPIVTALDLKLAKWRTRRSRDA